MLQISRYFPPAGPVALAREVDPNVECALHHANLEQSGRCEMLTYNRRDASDLQPSDSADVCSKLANTAQFIRTDIREPTSIPGQNWTAT